jgi:hypothetical protein
MSDIDVMQSLFDTKPMGLAMNWPVDVARFVGAIKELRDLCQDDLAPPDEIAKQWRVATAALGVEGMGSLLLERGEWQKLVYVDAGSRKPWREHDDYVVVWDQPTGCVVANVRMRGDSVDEVSFDVKKEVK